MLAEGVMLVPSRGEIPASNLLYFQVSEELKGSEESARLTDDKPLFNCESEVELSLCMGERGEVVSICVWGAAWPSPIPRDVTAD